MGNQKGKLQHVQNSRRLVNTNSHQ